MDFQHVDVFADTPFTGNSVTVFLSNGTLTAGQMLAITREFRHFESIFLGPAVTETHWPARVFDLDEELDFAGHPVLGAAAVLHDIFGAGTTRTWTVQLPAKTVTVQPPATAPGSAPRWTRAPPNTAGRSLALRPPRSSTVSGSVPPTWCPGWRRPWCLPGFATW